MSDGFEWDKKKSAANLAKHDVSFEEAATVFSDPLARELPDHDHSESEERYLIVGRSFLQRLLIVCWTSRGPKVRIISARTLTARERRTFESRSCATPMRDEYDLSGARPSRFADRFTVRERRELYESAASADLKNWLTESLRRLQRVEAELFAFLTLVEALPQERASAQAAASVESGALELARAGALPAGFRERFGALMRERSWLVHRGGIAMDAASASLESSVRLIGRMQDLAGEAKSLEQALADTIARSLSSQGLAPAEIERRTGEAEAWWRAA